MSSSYDPSVDRGALRRRAAEIGRRRLGTQPLSPDLATRRTGLKRSDDQAVAARRRLAEQLFGSEVSDGERGVLPARKQGEGIRENLGAPEGAPWELPPGKPSKDGKTWKQ